MTPERLDAIRADVADVERRAGKIAAWRAMPHPFAVESGLRTQGLRAPRLAADLRDLLAEVERLQAEVERQDAAVAEVQRLQTKLYNRPSCVVCGGSVHVDRFCGDDCYHKHYARLEEDDNAD